MNKLQTAIMLLSLLLLSITIHSMEKPNLRINPEDIRTTNAWITVRPELEKYCAKLKDGSIVTVIKTPNHAATGFITYHSTKSDLPECTELFTIIRQKYKEEMIAIEEKLRSRPIEQDTPSSSSEDDTYKNIVWVWK